MHYQAYKRILSPSGGMNIYRGCNHGCIYCDSRSACYGMLHDFEDIEVKTDAPAKLREELKAKRKKGMIGTGAGIMQGENKIFSYLRNWQPDSEQLEIF